MQLNLLIESMKGLNWRDFFHFYLVFEFRLDWHLINLLFFPGSLCWKEIEFYPILHAKIHSHLTHPDSIVVDTLRIGSTYTNSSGQKKNEIIRTNENEKNKNQFNLHFGGFMLNYFFPILFSSLREKMRNYKKKVNRKLRA